MKLKINLIGRELEFHSGRQSGRSLNDLIGFIEGNGDRIKEVIIVGETKSFTLLRQVYLIVNLLKKVTDCEVFLGDERVAGPFVAPEYRATGYEFKGE